MVQLDGMLCDTNWTDYTNENGRVNTARVRYMLSVCYVCPVIGECQKKIENDVAKGLGYPRSVVQGGFAWNAVGKPLQTKPERSRYHG